MGEYNPHAPQILGEEYVPIRDEDILFSPAVRTQELGQGFTLASSRTLADGRFYINDWPKGDATGQTYWVSVYPKGSEALSGPIQRVVIPCSAGGITGSGAALTNATTFAEAVADPSDNKYLSGFVGGTIPSSFQAFFATNQYSPELTGKRIVGMNLLYTVAGFLDLIEASANFFTASIRNNANATTTYGRSSLGTLAGVNGSITNLTLPAAVLRMPFGEVDTFWSTTLSPNSTSDRMPFTYTNLQRFEVGAANRIFLYLNGSSSGDTSYQIAWHYLALEVLYCQEQRVALGGRSFGFSASATSRYLPYVMGANIVTMRTPVTMAANPVLPAGEYTVMVSGADPGTEFAGSTPVANTRFPELNGIREYYALPAHPGVAVEIPFPVDESIVDKEFTKETVHVIPQLSLHASGGTLTEPQVYGRQAQAPVYGSIYAETEIDDNVAPVAGAVYPWVRYYARRFGSTTQPLVLTDQAVPSSTVSITVDEFDALPEILDGWKQVTLRFATPPTIASAAGSPDWRWTSSAETAGSQWQILGATAPALSGVPGNLFNLVPVPNQLPDATYGGSGTNLTWMYPHVTVSTSDDTSDGALMLAQDMPTVTGFELSLLTQTVTGIGQNCGPDPCCVPTGIRYHSITWAPTSAGVAASGFGFYEMQRMDQVDTDWATIMQATSPTASGFSDFEARIGLESSYRIRAVDVYGFEGPWSSTITATLTGPGIDIGCTGGHILVFTSNTAQAGTYNLAYSSIWESGRVEESFSFPEAGDVILQKMYGRDNVTAFHPLERGGERFSRTVLVQAAAIAPPTLGDFRSLRDMAWASVPYICVRDEDGNRWFATVVVPSGRVVHFRQLYMAEVGIIETSSQPYPVDPNA